MPCQPTSVPPPTIPQPRTGVRLRPREYGEIYALIERCIPVGDDPYAWRLQFVAGLKELFGAAWCYLGEHKVVGLPGTPAWLQPYSMVDLGMETEHQRALLWDWVKYGKPEKNPMVEIAMSDEWFGSKRLFVVPRVRFVDDETWYASEFYERFCDPVGFDDMMGSSYRSDTGELYWLVVQRRKGEPHYNDRDRRRLAVLTHLLMKRIGNELAGTEQDSVLQMPKRQRQVLSRLLQGDSEKQVAEHLGISVHTVNQYIQRMHKRFGVNSRGELLARAGYVASALAGSIQDVPLDHDKRLRDAMRTWPKRNST